VVEVVVGVGDADRELVLGFGFGVDLRFGIFTHAQTRT
jgi:hypothetical protein